MQTITKLLTTDNYSINFVIKQGEDVTKLLNLSNLHKEIIKQLFSYGDFNGENKHIVNKRKKALHKWVNVIK